MSDQDSIVDQLSHSPLMVQVRALEPSVRQQVLQAMLQLICLRCGYEIHPKAARCPCYAARPEHVQ